MPTTPNGFRYPDDSYPVAVPLDVQKLALDVDSQVVKASGGTFSGGVTFNTPPSVPLPTINAHAANKEYVDAVSADVTAIETELGTNPSGTFSTVVERLDTYTDGFDDVGNLLTANQASGGDALGNTVGFVDIGHPTTREYITSDAHSGAGCHKVTLTSGTSPHTAYQNSRSTCKPGDVITHDVWVNTTGTAAGSVKPNITFYRANGTTIVYAPAPVPVLAGSGWTRSVNVQVAPAEAAEFHGYLYCSGFAPGEYYLMDESSVHRGGGGQFRMPGYPIPGQATVAQNGAMDLSGTGLPEGRVAAAPGSTWLQTDSTTDVKGWIRWVKATGTGSTGWVAGAEADTGWRTITAEMSAITNLTWHAQTAIRRVGNRVTVLLKGVSSGATSGTAYTVPVGFRFRPGVVDTYWVVGNSANITQFGVVRTSVGGGSLTWEAPSNAVSWSVLADYPTSDAWPSSLPGSAA